MAYFTRSTMIGMITEMSEANRRFMSGGTGEDGADIRILIECQQKALALGEYIESLGMDYSDIVAVIEDYCNFVYEIAENLHDKDIVVENYRRADGALFRILKAVDDRIVEISSIDIFDFRGLINTDNEKTLVQREIDRLFDQCFFKSGDYTESEEFTRPLVVGTY